MGRVDCRGCAGGEEKGSGGLSLTHRTVLSPCTGLLLAMLDHLSFAHA